MINPYQYSGSYEDILNRMIRHAQQNEVDSRIFEILSRFYEKELGGSIGRFHALEGHACFRTLQKRY